MFRVARGILRIRPSRRLLNPGCSNGNGLAGSGASCGFDLSALQSGPLGAVPPEFAAQLGSALSQAMGPGGPGMGMMVMGVGQNERGKRVAKAASVEFDANGRVVSRDYCESQLDPDDLQINTAAAAEGGAADLDADVIEVTLEESEPPTLPDATSPSKS